MDLVNGRLCGLWVTCYSVQLDSGRWASYAKVCPHEPTDYWHAQAVFKLFGGEDHRDEAEAIDAAFAAASRQIGRLPSRDLASLGFAIFDDAHNVAFPLAGELSKKNRLTQRPPRPMARVITSFMISLVPP